MKKLFSVILSLVLVFCCIPLTHVETNAATTLTLSQLKAKFPDGKYWNHYVNSTSEAADHLRLTSHDESFANTVTSSACNLHGSASLSYFVGKYDCNYFDGGVQCFGFARKLGYDAFGTRVSGWSTTTSISSVKAGDVIRYTGGGASGEHSIFVISVSGTTVQVAECNWGKNCVIKWGRSINLSNVNIVKRYIAPRTLTDTQVSVTVDNRYPTPFKCRIISTSKVQCYNDAGKTSSPGYIYPDDDCVITEIYTNGLLKCECPWSDGSTKTVYIDKSAFINSSMTPTSMSAPQYSTTYLRSDGGTSIGWIDPGDSITKVAVNGSYTQIIYPASQGKRCGWVPTSALSAPDKVDYPVPFYCRIISTTKVKCYNDVDYTSSPGNIYPEDDCTITALYTNGKVQCLCPWSDGTTKTVYINSSAFFTSTPTPIKMTAPKYALTYLRTSDTSSWGWIDAGDEIYKLGTSGSMTQILYPTSSGKYRCGWVYTSDLNQTYTVSYNANGGTGAPSNQTKNYDVKLTLSSTVPTRSGYTFIGWATSSTATSAQYAAGGAYTANAGVTLYAVWKANQYNISYNANGGIGAPAPQTKTHGTSLTLSSSKPTREGYKFIGWSTSSTATSAQYIAGGTYTSNAGTTLYAVWKADTYTISYDANSGTNAPSAQIKTHDIALIVTDKIPTRNGYTFLGWALNKTSTTVDYKSGSAFNNNKSVTLYAVWQANTYTISYNANGGTDAPTSQTKTHGVSLTLSSVKPKRTGYTFLGWSTSSTATSATYQANGTFTTNANTVLYAVWAKDTVTVSKIEIASQPTKTVYQIGESLNTSGLSIKLVYSDNSSKTITSGFSTNGFSSATAGTKTITVSYSGFTTSFTVVVNNEAIDKNVPQIIIENKNAKPGETVEVQFKIQNAPKLKSFSITDLTYDTGKLKFEKAVCNVEGVAISQVLSNGNAVVALNSNTDINGLIFTYTFIVRENVEDCSIPISCTFSAKEKPENGVETTVDEIKLIPGKIVVKGKETIAPGVTVSGTVKSFKAGSNATGNEVTTIELIANEKTVYSVTVSGTGKQNYEIDCVEDGTYTVRVSKLNHVTREYEITVDGEEVSKDFEICLLGDVNGNGTINVTDYVAVLQAAKGTAALKGYQFDCANIDGKGGITVSDYVKVLRHAKELEYLW